ncbi:hypothetical protein A3759_10500 [Thalassolituus sp. HI0120]|nr:hypothetical protein A3759_10500 [Thalassolituus sp. HI0120]
MKIRSDIVRTYQALHTWTGITTGLLLFIGFFAGALTMFQGSIQRWADMGTQQVTDHWPVLSSVKTDHLIQRVVAKDVTAAKGFVLTLDGSQPLMSWDTADSELGQTVLKRYASLDGDNLLLHQSEKNQLSKLIDELHRTAGIAGEMGHTYLGVYVLGIAAIAYFLALISGVIFLLPTLVRSFFALRQKRGRFRYLLDTHNLVGVASLPFHIIIALTVVVFAFHDLFYGGLMAVYDDQPLFERQSPDAEVYQLSQLPSLQQFIDLGKRELPDYQLQSIELLGLDTTQPMARMAMQNPDRLMVNPQGDFLVVHPFTLAVGYNTSPTGPDSIWGRVVSSFFALHFGSYGGDWTRWVYFLLGLAGAYLFYSGNLLWMEKRRQQKNYSEKILRNMTALTLGVSHGCIAGIAFSMLLGRWFSAYGDINALYVWSYYLMFFACVGFAFWRTNEQLAQTLKIVCGSLCLLMPLTSLIGWMIPALGLPVSHTFESWLLEMIALLFALIFLRSARADNQLRQSHMASAPQAKAA